MERHGLFFEERAHAVAEKFVLGLNKVLGIMGTFVDCRTKTNHRA
jgi:hypothetical protein